MLRRTLLTLVFVLWVNALFSQHVLRSQIVHATTNAPVEMATIRLLRSPDSTFVAGVQSDMDGYFMIDNIKSGKYILYISSIAYKDNVMNVAIDKDVQLRRIKLKEDVALLESVEVRGTAVQLQVKGDTIEYNATAFKTPQNAVVEEMLKKMPGVEIDQEGKITINGEEIKKVRIDGKKFFGDDVQMATKNIPAEMIDKIQVLDQKSEMAELTGFEDDDTERIINLTLKPHMRRGYFANITGAGGADVIKIGGENPDKHDPRYDGNAFINIMGDKSQTSIVAGANNTNTQRSGRGRKNMTQGSGITNTQNIGVNTNSQFNDAFKFGGNFQGNHSSNVTDNKSIKDSYIGDNIFTNSDNEKSTRNNWDTRMILETEWKIDDQHTLIFQPEMGYSNVQSNSSNNYHYYNKIDSTDNANNAFLYKDTTSYGLTMNNKNTSDISGGGRIIYNYKFDKKGRTLTMEARAYFADSNSDRLSYSEKTDKKTKEITDNNQMTESMNNNYSMRMSYVEPLYANKHFLEASLGMKYNLRTNEKNQYIKDATTQLYTQIDSTYSSKFRNSFYSQIAELNYRYKSKKIDLLIGARANPSQTHSITNYLNGDDRNVIDKHVWNFSPTVSLKYTFDKKEFLRFDYRGKTGEASVNQMEPSRDNSNPMHETVGNPNLTPSFMQMFKTFYTHYNTDLFSSFVVAGGASFTQNALVNNSVYDMTGKRYSQTVNAEQTPYNMFGMIMYNIPIIEKRLHLNTRTFGRYINQVGYVSQNQDDIDPENLPLGELSNTNNLKLGEELSLTLTHDVAEVGLRGRFNYSHVTNNLNTQVSDVIDWGVTGNVTLYLPYQFSFNTDLGYTGRYGYTTNDLDEIIWNASLDKTFWQKQASLSIKAFDLLNQRKNIQETVNSNSIKYSTFNTLPTYVMLSFTYKLNKLGGRKMQDNSEIRPPFGGGGRPRSGGGRPRPF